MARHAFSVYALIALHLIVIVAILWAILEFRDASARRADSREFIAQVDALEVTLLNTEIAVTSYVLTGDGSIIEEYDARLSSIEAHTSQLGQRASGDRSLASRIEVLPALLLAKTEQWERAVDLREAGEFEDASNSVVDGRTRALLTDIREQLGAIRNVEAQRLQDQVDAINWLGPLVGVLAVALAGISLAVTGWLLVVARRRHENEALRRLNASKDQFVGFVSHEIRRPIAIIEGNTRQIAKASSSTERDVALAEITSATNRLETIVATLLALSRAEAGGMLEVEPVMVQRIAEHTARMHRQQFPDREITIDVAPDVHPALGDNDAIEQVLVNLLSNAEKYGDPVAPILIQVQQSDDIVKTSVRNQGPPQQQERFEHIFEPFVRFTNGESVEGGLGLGLTVSHRLITAQGGELLAEALPDGACFSFTLPMARETVPA